MSIPGIPPLPSYPSLSPRAVEEACDSEEEKLSLSESELEHVGDYLQQMMESYEGPWFWVTNSNAGMELKDIIYTYPVVDATSPDVATCCVTANRKVYHEAIGSQQMFIPGRPGWHSPSSSDIISYGVSQDKSTIWEVNVATPEFNGAICVQADSPATFYVTFSEPISLRELVSRYVGAPASISQVMPIFNPLSSKLLPTSLWDAKVFGNEMYQCRAENFLSAYSTCTDGTSLSIHKATRRRLKGVPRFCFPRDTKSSRCSNTCPVFYIHRTIPETPHRIWAVQFATMKAVVDVHNALVKQQYWVEVSNARTLRIGHPTARRVREIHDLVSPVAMPVRILTTGMIKGRYLHTTLTESSSSFIPMHIGHILRFRYIEDAQQFNHCYEYTPCKDNSSFVLVLGNLSEHTLSRAMRYGPLLYAGKWYPTPVIEVHWQGFQATDERFRVTAEAIVYHGNMSIECMSILGEVCKTFCREVSKAFASQAFWQARITAKISSEARDEKLATILRTPNINWGVAYTMFMLNHIDTSYAPMFKVIKELKGLCIPRAAETASFRTVQRRCRDASMSDKGVKALSISAMSGDISNALQCEAITMANLKDIIKDVCKYRPDLLKEGLSLLKDKNREAIENQLVFSPLRCMYEPPTTASMSAMFNGSSKTDYKTALLFSLLRDPKTRDMALSSGDTDIPDSLLFMCVNLGYLTYEQIFSKLSPKGRETFIYSPLSPQMYDVLSEHISSTEVRRLSYLTLDPRLARQVEIILLRDIPSCIHKNRIAYAIKKWSEDQEAILGAGSIQSIQFTPERPDTSQTILELVIKRKAGSS